MILDESQNATSEQMRMFLTRLGFGSKCVVTGDIAPGDAKQLESFLETQIRSVSGYGYDWDGSMVIVEMGGESGSFAGAIELGAFFAEKMVQTRILRGTTCAGPCALAFMGGKAKWTRFSREAVDRRLETGGQLIFRSPLYPSGDADPEKLRETMRSVQSYATNAEIPPVIAHVVFMLTEFQMADKATALSNESGASSHEAYKARQHERVRQRLFRDEDEPPAE